MPSLHSGNMIDGKVNNPDDTPICGECQMFVLGAKTDLTGANQRLVKWNSCRDQITSFKTSSASSPKSRSKTASVFVRISLGLFIWNKYALTAYSALIIQHRKWRTFVPQDNHKSSCSPSTWDDNAIEEISDPKLLIAFTTLVDGKLYKRTEPSSVLDCQIGPQM
jgi:hypothetical protein